MPHFAQTSQSASEQITALLKHLNAGCWHHDSTTYDRVDGYPIGGSGEGISAFFPLLQPASLEHEGDRTRSSRRPEVWDKIRTTLGGRFVRGDRVRGLGGGSIGGGRTPRASADDFEL